MGLGLGKMSFFRGSAWSFLAVSFRAIAGIVINKVFSVYLGAAGLTLLSHFQNLTALFTLLPAEGVNKAVMKYWSDPELERTHKVKLFNTALWVTSLIFAISFGLLYFWFRGLFFEKFLEHYSQGQFLLIFLPAVFLMLMAAYLNAVILAEQRLRAFGLINLFGSVLLVAVVYLGVRFGSMGQALLSLTVGYGMAFFCALAYFLLNKDIRASLTLGKPDRASLKKLGRFLAMAISAISLGQLLDFVIRDYIIDRYGLEITGLWQSVVKVSLSYTMLFTSAVSYIYYPRLCALIHEPEKLRSFVYRSFFWVAIMAIAGLSIYYFNRSFFLRLFFDEAFIAASGLVRYQVIGDFFGLISFLLTSILSAQVLTRKFIVARLFSALVFLTMLFLFIDKLDIESLPFAYMCRQIGLFLILIYLNRRVLLLGK